MIKHPQSMHSASSSRYIAISYVFGSNCTVILKRVDPQHGHAGVGMPLRFTIYTPNIPVLHSLMGIPKGLILLGQLTLITHSSMVA